MRTRIEPVSSETSHRRIRRWQTLVETYRRKADSLTSRVVATVKFPLIRAGNQYPLGSLIAEARRNVLRTDVGLVGNAGIRADLPAGPVTYGQLFEVQPSQNSLVKVTLTGARLREVLEHALDGGAVLRPTWRAPRFATIPAGLPGRRVRASSWAGAEASGRRGRILWPLDDFLAAGGDGYTMLAGLPAEPGTMLDVDGLIAYLQTASSAGGVPRRGRFCLDSR